MSLPQRKKSAEEIAKLREALGIPGATPDDGEPPAVETAPAPGVLPPVASPPPEPASPPRPPVQPLPAPQEPRIVQLSKPSEPVPVLAIEISGPPHDEEHAPAKVAEPVPQPPPPAAHGRRQVRSLRKSEQGPVPQPHRPPADSPLPVHRHSENEIKAIRKHEALAPHVPIPHPHSLTAHPVVYVPGYLLAIAGAVFCFHYDLAIHYTAACEGLALLLAAFIWFKKPLSRHHGAFIAVMVLLVAVFGALHYFPNLQYGT